MKFKYRKVTDYEWGDHIEEVVYEPTTEELANIVAVLIYREYMPTCFDNRFDNADYNEMIDAIIHFLIDTCAIEHFTEYYYDEIKERLEAEALRD